MQYKIALDDAVAQLQNEKTLPFVELMRHGSMRIESFAPLSNHTNKMRSILLHQVQAASL